MNGAQPLAGWVIAIVGARAMVGRKNFDALSPVFDLQSGIQMQQTPQGMAMARPCVAVPVLGMASIKSVVLPSDAILIPVEELSKSERDLLTKAVQMGEEIATQIRTAESGIVMAGAGTKLPPMKGAM